MTASCSVLVRWSAAINFNIFSKCTSVKQGLNTCFLNMEKLNTVKLKNIMNCESIVVKTNGAVLIFFVLFSMNQLASVNMAAFSGEK